jgi:hypothetical protein
MPREVARIEPRKESVYSNSCQSDGRARHQPAAKPALFSRRRGRRWMTYSSLPANTAPTGGSVHGCCIHPTREPQIAKIVAVSAVGAWTLARKSGITGA